MANPLWDRALRDFPRECDGGDQRQGRGARGLVHVRAPVHDRARGLVHVRAPVHVRARGQRHARVHEWRLHLNGGASCARARTRHHVLWGARSGRGQLVL